MRDMLTKSAYTYMLLHNNTFTTQGQLLKELYN